MRHREYQRRYRRENPDKVAAVNARRLTVCGMYLGRIGMTETELRGITDGTFK